MANGNANVSKLIFFVNGKQILEDSPNPEWTLLYYLRSKLFLCGTKEACGEGGCGACTVLQQKFDNKSNKIINNMINACLTPLCAVHGTAIITVEGIGSVKTSLHPVQERIAKSHGTQCGFCTPGFVMSMYALLRNNPEPTEQEMEDAFQGNLCRCTGYRPILAGYKTFCKQSSPSENEGCCGGRGSKGCCMDNAVQDTTTEVANTLFDKSEFKPYDPSEDLIFPPQLQLNKDIRKQSLRFCGSNISWMKPTSLEELLQLKDEFPFAKCVGGNTELGIETRFKQQNYPVLIHTSDVDELSRIEVGTTHVVVGGAVTLSDLQKFCIKCTQNQDITGSVLEAIKEMLHWFAGQQIRNAATLAGNIITASPISDLNPILIACGALVNMRSLKGGKRTLKMDDVFFPKYRTTLIEPQEILESVEIPITKPNEYVWAVKQARRREDDIAIVNACMRVALNQENLQIEDVTLAFGGMAPVTKLAKETSQFLLSKQWNEETLEQASNILFNEMRLDMNSPGGMVVYRQVLVQSFFKKFFMTVSTWLRDSPQSQDLSGVTPLTRGDTSGIQLYQIVPRSQKVADLVGRPIVHLSGLKHATGDAVYTDDELPLQRELHGALVGSPVSHGKIVLIDATKALALPGVVDFISAESLPKERNIFGVGTQDEEIFASEFVNSQGQTVGLVVATDPLTAEKAVKLVEIKVDVLPSILTIEDAIEKQSYYSTRKLHFGDIVQAFKDSEDILEGEMRVGGQEHFYMETQSCIVIPKEDQEMELIVSCQGPDYIQKGVAQTLQLPLNRVKVRCRRLGGSFGGKETRCLLVALPSAVAAKKLCLPVRTVMNRWDDMVVTGGRHPFLCRYKVGFTKQGKILGVQFTLYNNGGSSHDATTAVMEKALKTVDGAYSFPAIDVTTFSCKTNLPSNTAFRGYGGPQANTFVENLMDAVAEKVGKSPVDIREMHLKRDGDVCPLGYPIDNCTVRKCWEECVRNANYAERKAKVDIFNQTSQWKKRGITVMPMKHVVGFSSNSMNQAGALVMIYMDGSVGLNHGGTEMGQGLLTKMAQVASRVLEIPMESIYSIETSTDKIPNATATCGSMSSDLNGMAVKDACETLKKRLEPFKAANPEGKWVDWVTAAYRSRVSLSATGFYQLDLHYDFQNPSQKKPGYSYIVYGVAVSEVEIDCLTGDHSALRTDIVIDIGESLNPAIDVGQIEGAFIQGYGLFTMEELLYSPSGLMLTKGPGMYKIPSMGDIPREFNVSLLRGAPNPKAVYSSKGVGEPPLFLAASVYFAIKEAIKASRRERGLSSLFRLDCPATAERIRLALEDDQVEKVKQGLTQCAMPKGETWAITV